MLARYWRIHIFSTPANIHAGVAEVEFRGVAGGPDLTGTGNAISSGNYSATYEEALAFDNNTADGWASTNGQGNGSWIGYAFLSEVEILEVDILPRPTAPTQAPRTFGIEYSIDGSTWVSLKGYIAGTWVSGVSQTFTVPETPLPTSVLVQSAGVQRIYKPAPSPLKFYSAGVQVMRYIEPPVVIEERRRHVAMLF